MVHVPVPKKKKIRQTETNDHEVYKKKKDNHNADVDSSGRWDLTGRMDDGCSSFSIILEDAWS